LWGVRETGSRGKPGKQPTLKGQRRIGACHQERKKKKGGRVWVKGLKKGRGKKADGKGAA